MWASPLFHCSPTWKGEWKLNFSEDNVLYCFHFPHFCVLFSFGFELSKSIILAQLLLETEHNLENVWNVQHSLLAKAFANLAFTRVWKSDFSSLEEPNKLHDWMEIFVFQSNCLLQSRGSCGFGLMPKSTRPGQRHMASVMLGLFIHKCLHAIAAKKKNTKH